MSFSLMVNSLVVMSGENRMMIVGGFDKDYEGSCRCLEISIEEDKNA